MQTANSNTMHIVLLTRAIVKSDYHPDSIFTQQGIQYLNELYAKQNIEFKQRSIRKNEVRKELLTINQHLQLLYSDYSLPEEMLKLLCFISYMLQFPWYVTVKQIKRLFPGVSDIMIQEMDRHHAVVLRNNEYQEECLFFSNSILLFLFKRRNEYKTTDYLSAMSDVYTYIAGYNAFDNCNNLGLIFSLECNFVFDDMEALAFKWELLYFLESQYPNNACLKSIRETLEKNPESVKITDTAEKNNNAYICLLLQSNDQEAYKNLVERNFKIKTIYDSFLIKSWLTQADINYSGVSEISNMRHDKETPAKSNIIYNLVSIIQSYSSAGNINKNVLGQPDVTNFVIIEAMLSELQAGTLESTHMHSVMKQHLSEDELETLPDIFIDLKLYKKVIYYSAVFYISALFFNTDIQNTDYLCALSQIMDDLVHNYTIYSDDNRLMLLYQLANQQLLAGKIDEAQKTVEELAEYSDVPVWNGLTDEAHPTQILADMLTIREQFGRLKGINFVYMGDARFNMGNSLMVGCAKLGLNFTACCPEKYFPSKNLTAKCEEFAKESGSVLRFETDATKAVKDADVIYTDIWVSMGEPESVWAERIEELSPYQVNAELMRKTGKATTIFMHCLPSYHDIKTKIGKEMGEKFGRTEMEVTDEVFESKNSVVFREAENRMHTIKAVMAATLTEV